MILLNIVYAVTGLVLSRIVFEYVQEVYYRLRCRQNGCEPMPTVWSFPLGIPRLLDTLKQIKTNQSVGMVWEMFEHRNTTRFQQLTTMAVITMDPEIVKCMLATHFKEFDLGRRQDAIGPFLGDGIFTLSGSGWYHSRALLRPQFASDIVSRVHDLEKATQILISVFEKQSSNGCFFDAQDMFFRLTLDTATEFLFGESTNSITGETGVKAGRKVSAAEFVHAFTVGQDWCLTRTVFQRLNKLVTKKEFWDVTKTCHEFVDYYVEQVLQEKRTKPELLDNGRYFFLRELAKETDDAVLMRAQALNILLAGRDTTAALLSFTFSLLARNKDILTKLREAIFTDFGSGTENISFSNLRRCDYLRCVINEVLRLYPIVPSNSRRAVVDTVLPSGGGPDGKGPMFVPKGTTIQYSSYAMQRDRTVWGEDADEFKPERWETFRPPHWAYIPFNGGPRICLGQQFALGEASYVIVRLLQTFSDIELQPADLQEPIMMGRKLTMYIANGLNVRFIK